MRVTVSFFAAIAPAVLHPSHCTDLSSRCVLARALHGDEVGVGLVLEYD